MAVQVKGSTKRLSANALTGKKSVDVVDLKNYLVDGGVIYFVVFMTADGNNKRIFYNSMLPIKLRKFIENADGAKSITVEFSRFPDNPAEMTSLLFSFLAHKEKQAIVTSVNIPQGASLEELQNQDMLRGITMTMESVGTTDPIAAMLYENCYVYATLKGIEQPYPLEFVGDEAGIIDRVIYETRPEPISVNGIVFYDEYEVAYSTKETIMKIGKSVEIVFPPKPKFDEPMPPSVGINIRYQSYNMLQQRAKDLRFWLSVADAGGFEYKGYKVGGFNENFNASRANWDYDAAREELENLEDMVAVLDCLHIKKDIDITNMSDSERGAFMMLIQAIYKKQPIANLNSNLPRQFNVGICGLKIALVHYEEDCMPGESRVHSLFDKNASAFWCNYSDKQCRVPAYVFLDKDAWTLASNINYEAVAPDFRGIFEKENDPIVFEIANNTILPILLAYDETEEIGLLIAAKGLTEWLLNDAPSDPNGDVMHYLNFCQVVKRERDLRSEERRHLQQIAEDVMVKRFKVGANLLLGHQEAAEHHFRQLDEEEQENFRLWPIYRFWQGEDIVPI